eukprot:scaffold20577_cov62-Phaeocystis_antarctica.AAC.4
MHFHFFLKSLHVHSFDLSTHVAPHHFFLHLRTLKLERFSPASLHDSLHGRMTRRRAPTARACIARARVIADCLRV